MAHQETTMRTLVFGLALSALIAAPALACGTAKSGLSGPPIAGLLDERLAQAQLAQADLAKVRDLRATIATLVAADKIDQARAAEQEAMGILGYRKVASRCGGFAWYKVG
jgi:hypothetical protein